MIVATPLATHSVHQAASPIDLGASPQEMRISSGSKLVPMIHRRSRGTRGRLELRRKGHAPCRRGTSSSP